MSHWIHACTGRFDSKGSAEASTSEVHAACLVTYEHCPGKAISRHPCKYSICAWTPVAAHNSSALQLNAHMGWTKSQWFSKSHFEVDSRGHSQWHNNMAFFPSSGWGCLRSWCHIPYHWWRYGFGEPTLFLIKVLTWFTHQLLILATSTSKPLHRCLMATTSTLKIIKNVLWDGAR